MSDEAATTASGATAPARQLVDLSGRRAVVTGAGRGLGAQIAWRLVDAGAKVILGDLDSTSAKEVAASLCDQFGDGVAGARALDVTDTASIVDTVQAAVAEWDGLDIWINNAGIFPTSGPLDAVSDDHVDQVLRVNVRGSLAGAREAAKAIGPGGVIVNLASTAAFRTNPGLSAYIASKSAVVGLTRSLAIELAGRRIRVLGVAPCGVATPGVQEQMADLAGSGVDVQARLAANPIGRAAQPDDIARVVLFCCTPLAGIMTGSTLLADAGTTL